MIHIVLYQPEISPNTGNIIRSCFATNAKLHIIKPIAFELEPRYLKRPAAGKLLSDIEHEIHSNYDEFVKNTVIKIFTSQDMQHKLILMLILNRLEIIMKIFLMFGTESTGYRNPFYPKI